MSKKMFVIRFLLALLVMGLSLPPALAAAQGSAVVRVEASPLNAQVNDVINLAIKAENVANLTAFELHLAFNPAVVEVLSVSNGGFVAADFTAQNVFDNSAGTIDYAAAQMGRPPAQGSGTLLAIALRAKSGGVSPVDLRATPAVPGGLLLSGQEGVTISASWVNATLTVNENPSATPTPLPTSGASSPTSPPPSLTVPPTATLPANATVARVEPSAQQILVNGQANIAIKVDNVAALTAFELHLAFDPNILEVVEMTSGGFLAADFVAQNQFDNANGTLDYAVAQLGRPPARGSGTLLNIVFRAKTAGTSAIALRATPAVPGGVLLSGESGVTLPVSWVGGSVTVSNTITITPSAIPVTATPGAFTPTVTAPGATATTLPPVGATVVRVVPSASQVLLNHQVTVAITIENVANLSAFELHLAFDPRILEVVEVTNGGFVVADFVAQSLFDNAKGTIDYAALQIYRPPTQGSGTLLHIVFRAKAEGVSSVDLRSTPAVPGGLLLTGPNGVSIPASWAKGNVTAIKNPGDGGGGGSSYRIHVVRWGEYIYCIGRAYQVSPWAIIDANRIWWPYIIFPGQKLAIPEVLWIDIPSTGRICKPQFSTSTPAITPTAVPTSVNAPTSTPRIVPATITATPVPSTGCRAYYTVQRGDTLYRIATRYATTYTELARVNRIADARVIYVGQQLCIP